MKRKEPWVHTFSWYSSMNLRKSLRAYLQLCCLKLQPNWTLNKISTSFLKTSGHYSPSHPAWTVTMISCCGKMWWRWSWPSASKCWMRVKRRRCPLFHSVSWTTWTPTTAPTPPSCTKRQTWTWSCSSAFRYHAWTKSVSTPAKWVWTSSKQSWPTAANTSRRRTPSSQWLKLLTTSRPWRRPRTRTAAVNLRSKPWASWTASRTASTRKMCSISASNSAGSWWCTQTLCRGW